MQLEILPHSQQPQLSFKIFSLFIFTIKCGWLNFSKFPLKSSLFCLLLWRLNEDISGFLLELSVIYGFFLYSLVSGASYDSWYHFESVLISHVISSLSLFFLLLPQLSFILFSFVFEAYSNSTPAECLTNFVVLELSTTSHCLPYKFVPPSSDFS